MLIWSFLLAVTTPGAVSAASPPPMWRIAIPTFQENLESDFWQVVIEQQIIIRVPARRSTLNNFSAAGEGGVTRRGERIVWKEKKGPKCVSMRDVAGMQTTHRDSIDLLTRQNQRLRAQLNRGCQAHDFYAGFYMEGNEDGRLCEGRDQIHARTGAKCEVSKFRLMVPERQED